MGLLLVFVLGGCGEGATGKNRFEHRGPTMGTTFSVKVPELPEGVAPEKVRADIEAALNDVNASMSTYIEDSELSRFNASRTTDWFETSEDLFRVVKEALRMSEISGGAFDVTVGPLVNLWGFGPEHRPDAVPDQVRIDERLARVGYAHLALRREPPAVKKAIPDLYVDLSALAKGFGVDKVAEALESRGIDDYLVEVGGELRVRGRNARGQPWRIAIERPNPHAREVEVVVELEDGAVATSGDYRNYFESEGRRFSHTIDPRNGRPIGHRLASVTVLSHTAMTADAWATALMVLGPEAGFELAEEEGVAALLIVSTPDGFAEKRTSTFPDYYQVKP